MMYIIYIMSDFTKSLAEFLKSNKFDILKQYLKHQVDPNYYYYQCRAYNGKFIEILHDTNDTQYKQIIENYKFEPPITVLTPETIFSYIVTENGVLYLAKVNNSLEIGAKH